jgi:hypothetical protein
VRAVEGSEDLIPEVARPVLQMLAETLYQLDEQKAGSDHEVA